MNDLVTDRNIAAMTSEAYFAIPAVSASMLRCLATEGSWPYYHKYVLKTMPTQETSAMALGTLLHRAMEFDGWETEILVMPPVDGRTKEGKAARAAIDAESTDTGKRVYTVDDVTKVREMVKAIRDNPASDEFLWGCRHEIVGTGTCRFSKLPVKAKADILGDGYIVDFKTTARDTAEGFRTEAIRTRGYHYQAEWYMRVFGVERFIEMAVTNEPPHECLVYEFTDDAIRAARDVNTEQVMRLKANLEDGSPEVWHSEGWGGCIELGFERITR